MENLWKNVRQIYEGWKNDLLPSAHMKEQIELISQQRIKICEGCTYHSEVRKRKLGYSSLRMDVHCTHCGCPLSKKTKCLSCSCPLEKPLWTAVLTAEEDEKIKTQMSDE
jgi:hypothetical protein